MYSRHCRNKKNIFCRPAFSFIILGIITLVLFVAGLYHLRSEEWQGNEELAKENSEPIITSNSSSELGVISQETKIKSLTSSEEIGSATRGIDKGIFYHTVKVTLPSIDREKEYYEGWLLRQTPFDFFSTGEMVTNDDGDFVLEWAGTHDNVDDYNQVVITREVRDSNVAPGERVAEGKWE